MGLAIKVLTKDGEKLPEVEADFLSWINSGSYGPPALIAPTERPGGAKAGSGQVVLYVNTEVVATVEVERLDD
jgi:hypothetical protein